MPIDNPGGSGGINLTVSGNSTSAGAGYALVSSGTLSLAGGNNITLSQDGNKITVSGANAGGAQTAISGLAASNTTYTSGTVTITGVGGGITVSSNTGQRIDLSVAAQSVQVVQSAIQASDTTYTSGKVIFTGVGAITVSSNTGQRVDLSVAAQTVQTQNVHNLSVSSSNGGGTAGTMAEISSGTVTLYAGNNITLSQSATNKIVISGPNTSAQQTGISSIAASNTTYTSGQVEFTGSNMVTVKSSANQRVVIDATQSAQTQSNLQAVVPLGNTTGTTGSIQTGTFGLAGGANITISQSSGANSTNLTIIGGAGAGGGVNVAVTNTTYTSGTVIFSAAGGALTVTSGANQHVDISVPQTTSLSASTNITLSVTGSTIQFSVSDLKIHAWENMPALAASNISNMTAISKTPFYFPELIPGKMTINSVALRLSAVNTSTHVSFSVHFGVYTYANSTSIALLGSASEAFVVSSNSSASFSSVRHWVLTSPGTVAAISALTPGPYVFGLMFSAGGTSSMNFSIQGASVAAGDVVGRVAPGTNNPSTGTSQGVHGLYGIGSSTVNAMPANVVASELINQGTGVSAPIHPYLFIRS